MPKKPSMLGFEETGTVNRGDTQQQLVDQQAARSPQESFSWPCKQIDGGVSVLCEEVVERFREERQLQAIRVEQIDVERRDSVQAAIAS